MFIINFIIAGIINGVQEFFFPFVQFNLIKFSFFLYLQLDILLYSK